MRLTVEEIYNRLVNDDKILTKKGRITFTLGNIDIIVRQRDVVGNIMQEWVEGWLKKCLLISILILIIRKKI